MPGGDRTGPWGMGPRTGRGLGFCNGYPSPGYMYPSGGFGFGRGRNMGCGNGWGRSNRWIFNGVPPYPIYPGRFVGAQPAFPGTIAGPSDEEYLKALEAQKKYLEDSLEQLKQEIEKKSQKGA